jgi:hypothetical protein
VIEKTTFDSELVYEVVEDAHLGVAWVRCHPFYDPGCANPRWIPAVPMQRRPQESISVLGGGREHLEKGATYSARDFALGTQLRVKSRTTCTLKTPKPPKAKKAPA